MYKLKEGDNMNKINYRTAKKTIQKMSIGQTFNLCVMDPDAPSCYSIKKTADGYQIDDDVYGYHAFKYGNDFFKFLKVIFSNYTEIDLTIGELL